MSKENISNDLKEEYEKLMKKHSREAYLARLKRCGVILRDKDE